MPKKYRIKFELEDGRKVYTQFRGKIDEKDEQTIKSIKLETFLQFAYTPDLSLFGHAESLKRTDGNIVRIKRVIFEPTTIPVDQTAFTQNGPVAK